MKFKGGECEEALNGRSGKCHSGHTSSSPEKHGNATQSDSQLGPIKPVIITGLCFRLKSRKCRHGCAECSSKIPGMENMDIMLFTGVSAWDPKKVVPVPTSCPICYEDLYCTFSSFLPCSYGFMHCLVCHKRILEEDGRCPGCRKQYHFNPIKVEELDRAGMSFPLIRSCSIMIRS